MKHVNASSPTMDPLMREVLAIVLLLGIACFATYHKLEPRHLFWHLGLLVIVPLLATPLLRPFFASIFMAFFIAWSLYLSALVFLTCIYRLSPLHPLAKYPGPLVCRLTKIWFASIALGGRQYIYLQELHRRYGDVVRIGPNELSFCAPEMIGPMMGAGGMPKAEYWDGQFSDQRHHRALVGIRKPQDHMQRRKRWARAFTPDSLRLYKQFVERRVGQLTDSLDRRAGHPVDLAKWLGWFTYDVMDDVVFGSGSGFMQHGDANGILQLMENAQRVANFTSHIPWSAELAIWLPGTVWGLKDFRQYCRQRIQKRYRDGSPTKDLFYYLMDEDGMEDERPHFDMIAADASVAIVAGSDTTAPAISNIFYFLLCNPVVYRRLQEEVDRSGLELENLAAQSSSSYLTAVINESLRLLPPVPSGSFRSPLKGGGGHVVGNHFLPEGTTTYVHIYSIQRDPRYFSPLPDAFLPERWLAIDEQIRLEPRYFKGRENVTHNPAAFIPFSYGPADCIGKRLALQEIRMVVCAVLRRFQLRFVEGYDPRKWEADIRDHFVVKRGQLPVVLTRRA